MAIPEATTRHYARQQRLTAATLIAARREWAKVTRGDFDAAWQRVGPRLLILLAGTQHAAARDAATRYVPAVLDELGIDGSAVADVDPHAFAGIASDGRPLDSLLYEPVIRTKEQLAAGASLAEAAISGRSQLEMIFQTQLADAGRGAAHVGMVARPAVTRYVRMLNTPSCSRCAILAGRVYRLQTAFARHPRCDCRHIPTTENIAKDLTTDTDAYFKSLNRSEQDRIFTKAGGEAIRSGADIGQVVNARRGMYSADGRLLTREGTTRRGSAGKRLKGRQRLMPETIYSEARDREHAIELLRQHGYLS